jgi:hypothetical protein
MDLGLRHLCTFNQDGQDQLGDLIMEATIQEMPNMEVSTSIEKEFY